MAVPTIAIIGMGSRGLSILEQLIGMSRHATQQPMHIEVFDPQPPGSGLHHAQQADYLMLNTMAGQLSAFSSAFPACEPAGWTFLQWCGAHVRLDERGHVCAEGRGQACRFWGFRAASLTRALLAGQLPLCAATVPGTRAGASLRRAGRRLPRVARRERFSGCAASSARCRLTPCS